MQTEVIGGVGTMAGVSRIGGEWDEQMQDILRLLDGSRGLEIENIFVADDRRIRGEYQRFTPGAELDRLVNYMPFEVDTTTGLYRVEVDWMREVAIHGFATEIGYADYLVYAMERFRVGRVMSGHGGEDPSSRVEQVMVWNAFKRLEEENVARYVRAGLLVPDSVEVIGGYFPVWRLKIGPIGARPALRSDEILDGMQRAQLLLQLRYEALRCGYGSPLWPRNIRQDGSETVGGYYGQNNCEVEFPPAGVKGLYGERSSVTRAVVQKDGAGFQVNLYTLEEN